MDEESCPSRHTVVQKNKDKKHFETMGYEEIVGSKSKPVDMLVVFRNTTK